MKQFEKREPLMGQPNFFSQFAPYSYLSAHDWSYPEEDYPYMPVVSRQEADSNANRVADNQKGYIPNLSDF